MAKKKTTKKKAVGHYGHDEATRKNIPPAEMQSVASDETKTPVQVAYERRNPDLDPQLVWRGKDDGPLDVSAPPLYIQEKVHPKALMDDLLRQTQSRAGVEDDGYGGADLFADFNGLPKKAKSTDFYRHEGHWSNRMILGDSLQVMASLAEREGLRGKVQCIYFDPPYGIKFNSNFQWSTTSRDVKDGNAGHITREPEQVKAFRDTWRDGIHSYLTYLRDRLTVARDLLTDSGSIFVQIGDENVHRVRAVMDEVFGEDNFCSIIQVQKTGSQAGILLANTVDFLLWFAKSKGAVKYRQIYNERVAGHVSSDRYDQIELPDGTERRLKREEIERQVAPPTGRIFQHTSLISAGLASTEQVYRFEGRDFRPGLSSHWKTTLVGLEKLSKAGRVAAGPSTVRYKRFIDDFSVLPITDRWESLQMGTGLLYVVQTAPSVIERCLLMATDPGDLVLDPTCGSGTTATVAEQWGRRWITVDTSRVALALARARIMGARYPFYLLADSRDGQLKEAEVTRTAPSSQPVHGNIRHGFVYERVPHITLKSIANNAEIDVIWEKWQQTLAPLAERMKDEGGRMKKPPSNGWQEWEILREAGADWPDALKKLHADWWQARISRQKEIDKSISAKAEFEYLYDRPYENRKCVRVAGPFTVESVSPHRILSVGENEELIDTWDRVAEDADPAYGGRQQDFATVILENLKTAGVQQAHKEDRITFDSLTPIAGNYVCAEGTYTEGDSEDAPQRRAGVFLGPEFGTVSRPDLVAAAREAGDMGFDVLIACAFNYDAHSAEFEKLGALPVLKARMNADLHMAEDLKNTGKGNLFVIFGEPDIDIEDAGEGDIQVRINGVDIFKPSTGEVVSSDSKDIACWFIDTEYNEESFFVRHAYFLGQNDPYKSLKTTLKAEIDEEAWSSLNRDVSRPFPKPSTGRIAVKVINHLGDEVMKVFSVS